MEITRLRVSGFKSFSDPVELLLEAGLTGIVGPNGCGKSNIVEALRWAMGESSAKGLRGDEMDDVIFNGSATRPAHDVAEVRLKLRGHAAGLPGIDDSDELEVSRKISRGVGSAYRINGREARARDIQLLFADAGAGARSPAIIGQGQIGFIVDSKATDRRRLLEDAAGIGGLQSRRREAELRLQATQANLQRVLDLLTTQEARLAELGKQSRQAQRYRKLAAELRGGEVLLLLARYQLAASLAEAAVAAVSAASTAQEQGLEAATTLRRKRVEAAARLPGLRETAADLQATTAGLRERLTSLRAATDRDAAHVSALARQRDEVEADHLKATRAATELHETAKGLRDELASLTASRDQAARRLDELERADAAAADVLGTAQSRLRARVALAADARAQMAAADERLAALRARRDAIEGERVALPDIADARSAQQQAEANLALQLEALGDARAQLAAAEAELHAIEPQREAERVASLAAEQALAQARQRLAAEELRLRETRAAAARLAEQRAALQRSEERLAERRAALQARAQNFARTASDADVTTRQTELAAAESELAAADSVLDGAREALATAEQERSDTTAAWRDLRRSADAVAAEVRVLESLAPDTEVAGLLDLLEVPDELATAVATALGDDLLAGTDSEAARYWRELEALPAAQGHLPALPPGSETLLDRVRAPEVLHRRFCQIGLVDPALATTAQMQLHPGQRLVSVDGGLWRWDGFVRTPGSEDTAAARVRHHLRLHTARDEATALAHGLAERESATAAAEQAVVAARARLTEAEQRWRAADGAQLRARQRLAEAVAAADRRHIEAAQLEQETSALEREAQDLEGEVSAIDARSSELDDEQLQVAAVQDATTAATQMKEQLERQIAERKRLEAIYEAASRAVRERRTVVERDQTAVEPARATAERAGRHADALEAERRAREAALLREAEEIAAGLASAEPAYEAVSVAAARSTSEQHEAEQSLAAAEQARELAANALAAARGEAGTVAKREEMLKSSLMDVAARQAEMVAAAEDLALRRERLAAELADASAIMRSDPEAIGRLADELGVAEAASQTTRRQLDEEETALAMLERELACAEAALADQRERLAVAQSERGHARDALADAVTVIRDRLQQEPAALLADEATQTALATTRIDELEQRLAAIRASRDRLGAVNLRADVEASELEATVGETKARQAELQQAVDRLRAAIATLDREGRERLLTAFEAVDGHFRRLFAVLFGGGKAHLRLTGADDPLRAGLELEASPPGKKLTSISLLSGGEKTLTALALVFAFFLAQPSPLCVLDEVDAPLDDANVDRFVALMQEIAGTTGTRFLCVTHHPLTMARMDRLYGVTMAERGISRLVSVALERALELRATA